MLGTLGYVEFNFGFGISDSCGRGSATLLAESLGLSGRAALSLRLRLSERQSRRDNLPLFHGKPEAFRNESGKAAFTKSQIRNSKLSDRRLS